MDEGYQRYLDSKIRKDLPLHPTKKEKEYYAPEYEAKAENKEDLKQKNELLKRKQKEVAAFNKTAAKIDQEREEPRRKLLELEKEIIRKEEDDLLTQARNEIVNASQKEQEQANREFLREEIAAIKVVEASHPYSEPVSYDEATLQIWPQIENAPALRVEKEEAPVEEQPQVVEEAPQAQPIKVVEMSHPTSEPVTYEQATLQIWPQIANAPSLRVAPKEEPAKPVKVVAKPAEQPKEQPAPQTEPVKETPVVIQEVKVVEASHPYSEPVSYEQATLQIWPQIANAPILRVAPKEEEPVVIEKAKEEAPVKEEQPKVEPKPAVVKEYNHPHSDPVTYDEATLEIWPNLAKAPALRVAPKEEKKEAAPKKAPVKKAEPKVAPQKEAEPKPAKEEKPEPVIKEVKVKEVPVEDDSAEKEVPVRVVVKPREKIPGRFIVKLMDGYYVDEKTLSPFKEDAKVFDDFNLAKDIKKEKGGKIVKL